MEDDGTEDALDALFEDLDTLFLEDRFEEADDYLRDLDLPTMNICLMVGALSITLCARDKLPYREDLLRRVEERLQALAPDRVEGLLTGLR